MTPPRPPIRLPVSHAIRLSSAIIGAIAAIAAAVIGARAIEQHNHAQDRIAALQGAVQRRDADIAALQAQIASRRDETVSRDPLSSQPGDRTTLHETPPSTVSSPDSDRMRSRFPTIPPNTAALVTSGTIVHTGSDASAPARHPIEPRNAIAPGIAITELPILMGSALHKSGSVVFGEARPTALWFPKEKLIVRTGKKYRYLDMLVGVEDNPDGQGSKHFWVFNENDELLFEGSARAGHPPVTVHLDISDTESIAMHALDYNGQTPELLRWVDARVIPK